MCSPWHGLGHPAHVQCMILVSTWPNQDPDQGLGLLCAVLRPEQYFPLTKKERRELGNHHEENLLGDSHLAKLDLIQLTKTLRGRCINPTLQTEKLRLRDSRVDCVKSKPGLSEDKAHDFLSLANQPTHSRGAL